MHGKNYRHSAGMPYTRKKYVGGSPQPKVAKFSLGKASGDYDLELQLISASKVQVRHNALEAARVAANKKLQDLGESNYYLLLKVYPHVILRENKMIATAGADRLQEGMRRAFGKPVGLAARVDIGNIIMIVRVKSADRERAKEALKVASSKLPMETRINAIELKQVV
ncbi:MAG: 50S ribosomal protein L16 [Nitrososphaeria archaeon]